VDTDPTSIPAVDRLKLVRASTRFEVRIRPRDDDGNELSENIALLRSLDEVARMVATARNVTMRSLERADAAVLDAFVEEHHRLPARADEIKWPSSDALASASPIYTYRTIRAACPQLDTACAAWLSKDVHSKWREKRWLTLIAQTEARPHCKPTHPIPIPAAAVRLGRREDGSMQITFRLFSTEVEGARRIMITLVPRDARQRMEIDSIASGEWKLGQVVLSRHHEKRGRWFVRLTHTRLVAPVAHAGVVAVRRGMRAFLVGAASDGDVRTLDDGADLLEHKRRFDARRREIGRRLAGDAANGHGTRRRTAALIDLTTTEKDYSTTRCARSAAAVVEYAKKCAASRVVLEDLTIPKSSDAWWLVKRWPWFMLKTAITNACEAAGLAVEERRVSNRRTRCPECTHEHLAPPVDTRGTWQCVNCAMTRSADQVDALNMLRDAGAADGVAQAAGNRRVAVRALAAAARGDVARKPAKEVERKCESESSEGRGRRRGPTVPSARKPTRKCAE